MCIIKADVKSWQIIAYRKRVPDMRKKWIRLIAAAMGSFLLAGCGADTQIDDYATNAGAESLQQTAGTESAATTTIRDGGNPEGRDQGRECSICQTRQKEADTRTRMIWEFRECSRTSDFPTIRLCGKSMSQIPMRMRQSRRFRNVSTRAVTLSLRPAGVTWSRQRRWRRNIRIFIFPMEPVI